MSDHRPPTGFALVKSHPLFTPLGRLATNWHIVGGSLRDAALGLPSNDLDVSVASKGRELTERLAAEVNGRAVVLGGDQWASYRVVLNEFQMDIWDRQGGSLYADQERRDLTINSIAYDVMTETVEDPFQGLIDLEAQLLRATRRDCFERDPLRVLRLARFRLELTGFRIDDDTRLAARSAASRLPTVATERVREELERLLSSPAPARAFETLIDLAVLPTLLPGISGSAVDRAHDLERRRDLLSACGDISAALPADYLTAAVAVLLRERGRGRDSKAVAAELQDRGLLSKRALRLALDLAEAQAPRTEDERRIFLVRYGHNWPTASVLAVAVITGPGKAEAILEELADTAHRNPELVLGLTPLLDGGEVSSILQSPGGPEIGRALAKLVEAQATGKVRTRAEAQQLVSGLAASDRGPR